MRLPLRPFFHNFFEVILFSANSRTTTSFMMHYPDEEAVRPKRLDGSGRVSALMTIEIPLRTWIRKRSADIPMLIIPDEICIVAQAVTDG